MIIVKLYLMSNIGTSISHFFAHLLQDTLMIITIQKLITSIFILSNFISLKTSRLKNNNQSTSILLFCSCLWYFWGLWDHRNVGCWKVHIVCCIYFAVYVVCILLVIIEIIDHKRCYCFCCGIAMTIKTSKLFFFVSGMELNCKTNRMMKKKRKSKRERERCLVYYYPSIKQPTHRKKKKKKDQSHSHVFLFIFKMMANSLLLLFFKIVARIKGNTKKDCRLYLSIYQLYQLYQLYKYSTTMDIDKEAVDSSIQENKTVQLTRQCDAHPEQYYIYLTV